MKPNPRWTRDELERSWTQMQATKERYEAALREIAMGKVASDNENPLGEGQSMAGRFLTIAQRALRSESKAEP